MSSLFKRDVRSLVLHALLYFNIFVKSYKDKILSSLFAHSSSAQMPSLISLFAYCQLFPVKQNVKK